MILESWDGFKWFVEKKDHFLALSEVETLPRNVLKEIATKEKIFVDVGAHVGEYTVRLAKYFKKVIAIEANPASAEVLKKNLELNGIKNVEVINVAVGRKRGKGVLNIRGGSSTLLSQYESPEKIEVKVVPLDELIEGCDVIKIDVEGYEEEVIRGASKIIFENKPVILIEHHEYREYKDLKGMRERIRMLLKGYRSLCIDQVHWLYVPRSRDLRNYPLAVTCHWVCKILYNIEEDKPWYYGLPYTWWYGMGVYEFIMFLPKHIKSLKEDAWFKI